MDLMDDFSGLWRPKLIGEVVGRAMEVDKYRRQYRRKLQLLGSRDQIIANGDDDYDYSAVVEFASHLGGHHFGLCDFNHESERPNPPGPTLLLAPLLPPLLFRGPNCSISNKATSRLSVFLPILMFPMMMIALIRTTVSGNRKDVDWLRSCTIVVVSATAEVT